MPGTCLAYAAYAPARRYPQTSHRVLPAPRTTRVAHSTHVLGTGVLYVATAPLVLRCSMPLPHGATCYQEARDRASPAPHAAHHQGPSNSLRSSPVPLLSSTLRNGRQY
eukprot:1800640-Rhodomonas_salina.2